MQEKFQLNEKKMLVALSVKNSQSVDDHRIEVGPLTSVVEALLCRALVSPSVTL